MTPGVPNQERKSDETDVRKETTGVDKSTKVRGRYTPVEYLKIEIGSRDDI